MMFNQPSSAPKEDTKTAFKCPEGRYTLTNARNYNLLLFNPHRATKLTLAELASGRERATFVIFNVGDFLHVCTTHGVDKVYFVVGWVCGGIQVGFVLIQYIPPKHPGAIAHHSCQRTRQRIDGPTMCP